MTPESWRSLGVSTLHPCAHPHIAAITQFPCYTHWYLVLPGSSQLYNGVLVFASQSPCNIRKVRVMAGRESEGKRLCLMHLLPHWVVVSNVSYELYACVAVHFLCGHTEKKLKACAQGRFKNKRCIILYYTMLCLNTGF